MREAEETTHSPPTATAASDSLHQGCPAMTASANCMPAIDRLLTISGPAMLSRRADLAADTAGVLLLLHHWVHCRNHAS